MAFVVALSVATLPVAGTASIVVKSAEMAVTASADASTEMAEMSAAMDECCPDSKPCDQRSDQCQSMASCALQSANLADVAVASLKYPPLAENAVPVLVDQAVPLHGGSPPFRPPRV